MKYGVIGVGAVGGYYGGRLALSGYDVHFLFNSDYEFVKENGLRVDSIKGNFHLKKINAYSNSNDMPKCDVIIVSIKTTCNHLLKSILPPILKENSIIILFQNGIDIEKELANTFPNFSIAGGLPYIFSNKISKGYINHFGYGMVTVAFYNKGNMATLNEIKKDFENSKIEFTIESDLNTARWMKLIWNIPFNGLSVILAATMGDLMKNKKSRQIVVDLLDESFEAAKHCGAIVNREYLENIIKKADTVGDYSTSMKLDYENNRKMEIASIYSNAIKLAKEKGFIMKKTEVIEQQLIYIEETKKGKVN